MVVHVSRINLVYNIKFSKKKYWWYIYMYCGILAQILCAIIIKTQQYNN